jgi:hypothetical protein
LTFFFLFFILNIATISENLELLTASLITSKRSKRRENTLGAAAMQVDEPKSSKKISSPPALAIKRSAAAIPTVGAEPKHKVDSKKRVHGQVDLESTLAKKPKTKENELHPISIVAVRQPRPKQTTVSHKLNTIKSSSLDKHRQAFRKSVFEVLRFMVSTPECQQSLLDEMSKVEKNSKNGDVTEGVGRVAEGNSKISETSSVGGFVASGVAPSSRKDVNESEINTLSEEIEQAWYAKCGRRSEDPLYNEQLRSLRFSLKNNPSLVARLVLKTLTPQMLSTMTAEEMAPSQARAALEELRAEDEMNRNKAAETEGEKKHEKELFKMRGKTDDRLLPTLPVFVPPPTDDDDLNSSTQFFSADSLKNSSSSSSALNSSGILNAPSEMEKKSREADLLPSDSGMRSVTDPSLLMKQQTPLLPAAKVDLDLDSFNVPQLNIPVSQQDPSSLASHPSLASPSSIHHLLNNAILPRKIDAEVQTGIRSILDEIAMETGGTPLPRPPPTTTITTHESQFSGDDDHMKISSSVQKSPQRDIETSTFATPSFIVDDSDYIRKINSPVPNTWSGSLNYTEVCPTAVQVSLTAVGGVRMDRVLSKIGLTSIDISRVVDLDKILSYLPQLDASSSRVKAILYFEPLPNDPVSQKKYKDIFTHLITTSQTGVVAIKGDIAKESIIREVYILPLKAGDQAHPSVFPSSSISSTEDRLYLSLVCDKKAWQKLKSEMKSSRSAPSSSSLDPRPHIGVGGGSSYAISSSLVPSGTALVGSNVSSVLGGSPYSSSAVLPSSHSTSSTSSTISPPVPKYSSLPPVLGGNISTSQVTHPMMLGGRLPQTGGGGGGGGYGASSGYPAPSSNPPPYDAMRPSQPPSYYPPPQYQQHRGYGPSSASSTHPSYHHNHNHNQQHHQHQHQQHRGGYPYGAPQHSYVPPHAHTAPPSSLTSSYGSGGGGGSAKGVGGGSYAPSTYIPPSASSSAPSASATVPTPGSHPPSTASNAAMNFLDSLKGVDLAHLLGPPK